MCLSLAISGSLSYNREQRGIKLITIIVGGRGGVMNTVVISHPGFRMANYSKDLQFPVQSFISILYIIGFILSYYGIAGISTTYPLIGTTEFQRNCILQALLLDINDRRLI